MDTDLVVLMTSTVSSEKNKLLMILRPVVKAKIHKITRRRLILMIFIEEDESKIMSYSIMIVRDDCNKISMLYPLIFSATRYSSDNYYISSCDKMY